MRSPHLLPKRTPRISVKLLLLCEGDAESPHGSFSGSSYSILQEIRRLGHQASARDVEIHGWDRWLAGALTAGPDRERWAARFRLGQPGFALRSRRARLAVRATSPRPDVVLQIGATFSSHGTGVPVVLYCDSNIRMAERGRAGFSDAWYLTPSQLEAIAAREAIVYRHAALILTITDRLRRSFIEDFGIPADRVVTTHAGGNFALPDVVPVRSCADGRAPTILFVGKQFERKGGDILLKAFRAVRARLPEARLLIAGPTRIPDTPGAECLGYLRKDDPDEAARLREAYETADVFCLPTRYEPFGISYAEAMAFGLPCIGPDAWAVPEVIDDGVTGLLHPPEDSVALADRLLELLTDPERAARMGAAGRRRAEEHMSWPSTVHRMMTAIEPVVVARTTAA